MCQVSCFIHVSCPMYTQNIYTKGQAYIYAEKTSIPFPFTLNGIWSWWHFSFRFSEPNGKPFDSKSKGKQSPRSYPIQCERKWRYSFLSVGQASFTLAVALWRVMTSHFLQSAKTNPTNCCLSFFAPCKFLCCCCCSCCCCCFCDDNKIKWSQERIRRKIW